MSHPADEAWAKYTDGLNYHDIEKFDAEVAYKDGFDAGYEAALPKWRPIVEAPKVDCKPVLLGWDESCRRVFSCEGVWSELKQAWCVRYKEIPFITQPTHYQPLPEGPKG